MPDQPDQREQREKPNRTEHAEPAVGGDDARRRSSSGRGPAWILIAIALLACVGAGYLGLWSLGRGLTSPGEGADRESELLALGAALAAILALTVVVQGIFVWRRGWPLPQRLQLGIVVAFFVAVVAVTIPAVIAMR